MTVQEYGRPHGRGSGAFAVTAVLVGSLVGSAAASGCAAPPDPKPPAIPTHAEPGAPDAQS
ncbi:hypothetical protein ABTY23_23510, partial [Streptomyces sp. NPDC096068]